MTKNPAFLIFFTGLFFLIELSILAGAPAYAEDTLHSTHATISGKTDEPSVLFDFYWAPFLHRFFDAYDRCDKQGCATELKAWEDQKGDFTAIDDRDRTHLVTLLSVDNVSFERAVRQLLQNDSASWSLLLALEQLHNRRGRHSLPLAGDLEYILLHHCHRFLEGYSEGVISKAQLSPLLHQAISRLTNDDQSLELMERAISLMNRKGHPIDVPLLALQTDRLLELSSKNKEIYQARAIQSNRLLCLSLKKDPAFLKTNPLALAKSHYLAATYEIDANAKLAELTTALSAAQNAAFEQTAVSGHSVWEARGLLKDADDQGEFSQAKELFYLRQERLRASILVDGFNLLKSNNSKGYPSSINAYADRFSVLAVSESLARLDRLQQRFRVEIREQLVTLLSLAAVLQERQDPTYLSIVDRAMPLTAKVGNEELSDEGFSKLVLDVQIGWIESQMIESRPQGLNRISGNDLQKAIDEIKKNPRLATFTELDRRLRKAELLNKVSLGEVPSLTEKGVLMADEPLFIRSLELILAARAGDFEKANQLKIELLAKLENGSPEEKMLPLYALSELEIEMDFHSIESIIRLHKLLEQVDQYSLVADSAFARSLRFENAFQIASATAHFRRMSAVETVDYSMLNELTMKLAENFGIRCDTDHYRHLFEYLSKTDLPISRLTMYRAQVALVSDQLKDGKDKLFKARLDKQSIAMDSYIKSRETLKEGENRQLEMHGELVSIANKAEGLLSRSDSKRYSALKNEHDIKKKTFEEQQAHLKAKQRAVVSQFTEIFSVAPEANLSPEYKAALGPASERLSIILKKPQSNIPVNLRYNIICLLLESAILLGAKEAGCSREELNEFACSVAQEAVRLRSSWRGWHHGSAKSTDATIQNARNRLFDRYQLGFELAVRWSVEQNDFRRALEYAAVTTNRSFADFKLERSKTTESASLFCSQAYVELPKSFIAYFSGNESLHVFWRLDGGEIEHFESSVNRTTLSDTVVSLRKKYAEKADSYEWESSLLASWLLPKDLCDTLMKRGNEYRGRCIYIAPHGPLFQLPLEGLPIIGLSNNAALGDLQPLIYVPTLVPMQGRISTPQDRHETLRCLTIRPGADVGSESEHLLERFGGQAIQLGPMSCTKQAVVRELKHRDWEIVHFGAHAKSVNDGNEDAFIDLRRGEAEGISTSDLQQIELSAQHVFLSACETQTVNLRDLQSGGNTMKSLGTTFLAIGAQDVISSSWRVHQESTSDLFKNLIDLYVDNRPSSGLTTEMLAELLFRARNSVRNAPAHTHPFHWCAFTIWTADWRQ